LRQEREAEKVQCARVLGILREGVTGNVLRVVMPAVAQGRRRALQELFDRCRRSSSSSGAVPLLHPPLSRILARDQLAAPSDPLQVGGGNTAALDRSWRGRYGVSSPAMAELSRASGQTRQRCGCRRGGREAEGGGLLNRYTVESRIMGSNPILSANLASRDDGTCSVVSRLCDDLCAARAMSGTFAGGNRAVAENRRQDPPVARCARCVLGLRRAQRREPSLAPTRCRKGPSARACSGFFPYRGLQRLYNNIKYLFISYRGRKKARSGAKKRRPGPLSAKCSFGNTRLKTAF
jgi:hypothetical protein